MRTRSASLGGRTAALVVLVAAAVATSVLIVDSVVRPAEREPAQTWAAGTVHGPWTVRFDGFGRVGAERSAAGRLVSLAPRAARTPAETHAALVTSTRAFGDVEFRVRMLTRTQLRRPRPNPWEVAWVVWDFADNTHFDYAVLKPNGWEIGQAAPEGRGGQRILATGTDRRFPVGRWHELRVRQSGARTTVWANGHHLTTVTDDRAYVRGQIGLYTEDADVRFGPVHVLRPPALLAPPRA